MIWKKKENITAFHGKFAIRNSTFSEKNRLIPSFILHSIPTQNETRQQWIDAINKHQNVDLAGRLRYFLCSLHFEPASVKILQSKIQLAKGTVPTIFSDNATETTKWKAPRNSTEDHIDRWANLQIQILLFNLCIFKFKFDFSSGFSSDDIALIQSSNQSGSGNSEAVRYDCK